MKEQSYTDHEAAIFKTLQSWTPPEPGAGFNERILQRLEQQSFTARKFGWAWAAMIAVVVVNIFITGKIIREHYEYRQHVYSSYIKNMQDDLLSNQTQS